MGRRDLDNERQPHPPMSLGIILAIAGMVVCVMVLGIVGGVIIGTGNKPTNAGKAAAAVSARHGAALFFPPVPIQPSRSPLLRTGEHLTHLIPFKRLARWKVPPLPADRTVPWGRASWYVGQRLAVVGRVVEAKNIGPICFLDFSHHWQGQLAIVIYRRTFHHWTDKPQRYFPGKQIKVRGKVVLYKGRPEIQVRSAGQVTVLPARAEH